MRTGVHLVFSVSLLLAVAPVSPADEPTKSPQPQLGQGTRQSAEESQALHRELVAQANAAVAKARARAEKDPNRPAYHFQAPALWMNDPNGPTVYQGEYHLFYQHNPYGVKWGHMHWGHAKSKDLVHWQHLPIALAPSRDRGEEHCFSGCAVVHNGIPTIIYTSIGPKTPAAEGAVQWMATSRDGMLTWDKYAGNPILTGDVHKGVVIKDWRDPFVWQEGDNWFMVLGGHREGGRGCAVIYQSSNLTQWKYLNILYEGEEKNWECPNFFKLGEKWVLVYSPHGLVKYYTGTLGKDSRFQPEAQGTIDLSATYYAPNSLRDANGRRIMWGWLRVQGDGWNGALSLPRILSLRSDGRLGMEPAPELQALRGEHHRFKDLTLLPRSSHSLKDIRGDCLEIRAEFEPGDAGAFGLQIHRSPDKEGTLVFLDRDRKQLVAGPAKGPFDLLEGEKTLSLRVFVDRSVLEVYANGRECITAPLPAKGADNLRFSLFARGGRARVTVVDVWRMKSMKD